MFPRLSKLSRSALSFFLVCFVFVGMMSLSTPSFADDLSMWRKALGRKVGARLVYPKSAIRKRIQGRAIISITVDRQGQIQGYEIVTLSGKAALDKVIEKSVKRFNPLPKPPASVDDSKLTFKVALDWAL